MSDQTFDEGYDIAPVLSEPPEGDVALARQEEAAGTDAIVPVTQAPPVVGRTWALDPQMGRLLPLGSAPISINGPAAMRQAIVKALSTSRDSAPVQGTDYGMENADRQAEGQPFDHAAFAEREITVRDALLALPWVLDVTNFDADGSSASDEVLVSFRVIPEGDAEPITFDRYPLPAAL